MKNNQRNFYLKKGNIFIFLGLLLIVVIYYFVNPANSSWFLSCPLKSVTGYDCPGCGTQRALHALLHFRIREAFCLNPLFVIALVLFLVYLVLRLTKNKTCLNIFRSKIFWIVAVILILLFGLIRNTDAYFSVFGC